MNPKRPTQETLYLKFQKLENIKSNKGKATSYIQGNFYKTISWIFSRNFAGQKGVAWYIQSDERKKSVTKNTLLSKAIIQIWRRDKEFYRQAEAKGVQHQLASQEMLQGLL